MSQVHLPFFLSSRLPVLLISIFLVILLSAFTLSLHSQIQLIKYDSVVVTVQEFEMQDPWAGGLNSPQFSEMSLNDDGLMDLVVFERNFYGAVKTYIKGWDSGESAYFHAPIYQEYFPRMRNWMLMRDYNCDQKQDIFTSVPGGVAVYRNDGIINGVPEFNLVYPLLMTFGLDGTIPLFISPADIPAITDVDNDGDLDILTFNIIGSTIEYHKNLSMENHGDCNHLEFELRNACWGYFSEDGNNNTVTLFDTCDMNVSDPEKTSRHAGSSILAIDLTGNGVKDVLLGDITYNNLVALTNGGTTSSSIMVEQDVSFPSNTKAVDIEVFPAGYEINIQENGLKDLLIAPNNPNTSENYGQVWHYRQEQNSSTPVYTYMKDSYLVDRMLDVGERSFPAFFDENGDGAMDIVVGNYGYFEGSGNYSSQLLLLRSQEGANNKPSYDWSGDNYLELDKYDFNGIYPAFGDMDSDGDQDMIIGDEDGHLHYFRNDGGAGNQADLNLLEPNYKNIDVGSSAKPQIIDVDRDGKPDLLLGERGGRIIFYRNTGTAEVAVFSAVPTSDFFGEIDVMPECCTGYSAPHLLEDSLGNYILYVGSEQGILYLFDNIDNNLTGAFNLLDSLYLHGVNINVSSHDIDFDGKPEFVYGEYAGGIGLLKHGTYPLNIPEIDPARIQFTLFPNPAMDAITIKFSGRTPHIKRQITIMDLAGRIIIEPAVAKYQDQLTVNVGNISKGIYLVLVSSEGFVQARKFIKQ